MGFLEKNIYRKETLALTIPVFFELLISSLFGVVDMMMVGNSGPPHISTPSIAATGVTNQIILIGIAIATAFGSAGTAIIARYCGAKRKEEITDVLKHLIIIVVIFLIVPFGIFTQNHSIKIMKFIGAETETINIGLNYFKITTIGFLFQAFNLSAFAAIRGSGDTKTPMTINIVINLLNVFGNYILIFGKLGLPALGITGAGISTALSHVIATIALITILLNKNNIVHLDFKKRFKFSKSTLKNIARIGLPAAIEQAVFRIGVVFFIKIIAGLGTTVYATHQIASNIVSLSFAPGQAFGIATSTLVGHSLGEKRIDKAEIYVKESNHLALFVSIFYFLLFFFLGPELVKLYTKDSFVILASVNVMKIIACIQPFQASAFAISGGLRGAGDTVSTLIVNLFGVIFIRLSFAYLLINILNFGIAGAWLSMLIDQIIRWIGIKIRFKSGKWKNIKIY